MSGQEKFNLQERFIRYSVRVINVCNALLPTDARSHIYDQLLRSGTAVAANYAEAQGAESRNDFIHKVKISLKELRETEVWLKIIMEAKLVKSPGSLNSLLDETGELIAIFVRSIRTAKENNLKK